MPDGVTARVLRLTPSRLGPSHARRSCPPVRRPGGSVFAAQYPAYAHPCQRSSDSPLEESGFEPSVPLETASLHSRGREGAGGRSAWSRKTPSFHRGQAVRISLTPPRSLSHRCLPLRHLPFSRRARLDRERDWRFEIPFPPPERRFHGGQNGA